MFKYPAWEPTERLVYQQESYIHSVALRLVFAPAGEQCGGEDVSRRAESQLAESLCGTFRDPLKGQSDDDTAASPFRMTRVERTLRFIRVLCV